MKKHYSIYLIFLVLIIIIIGLFYIDIPSPSTPALSKNYYPRAKDICMVIEDMLGSKINMSVFEEEKLPHDVPDPFFKGPF